MPPPTNISAATATPITLAAPSVTQDVHDGGTTYAVWYAFTAGATETWVSVWACGDLTTYQPSLSVWLGPPGAPTLYLSLTGAQNVPVQMPVASGTTYYFKMDPNTPTVAPAVLTLSLVRGPQQTVPIGAIAVNDDTGGYPLIFLSPTTGAPVNLVANFPAGEAADVLPSGVVAVANGLDSRIQVYDATLTLVGTVPYAAASGSFGFLRAHGPSHVFYVGDETTGAVRTITPAAAFGPTTWTTGANLLALAVNQAATTLYYSDARDHKVKKWTLATNTSGGDFQPYLTGTQATDLLVLADDTVLIAYTKIDELHVVHYTAAGTVVRTYDYTGLANPASTMARLASSAADPDAFWIWTHHFTPDLTAFGFSRFRKIQVSDGTALTTLDTTEFESGIFVPPPTLSPTRFGHSYSCHFWETRTGTGRGGGPFPPDVAPSYALDARPIRRLRRAPHVAQENARVVYRKFELDLERGVGLATGQGSDPQVLFRVSRDGGHTWSEPLLLHAGALGAYTQRVIARRLGQARDAVFEVTVSDPVAWSLVQAWLDLEPGTS